MDRNTLYEGLQDHELVQKYDDVRGMVKNMFFVNHKHKENGGTDDTASKYNVYEVRNTVCIERKREGHSSCGTQGGDDPRPRTLPPAVGLGLCVISESLTPTLF